MSNNTPRNSNNIVAPSSNTPLDSQLKNMEYQTVDSYIQTLKEELKQQNFNTLESVQDLQKTVIEISDQNIESDVNNNFLSTLDSISDIINKYYSWLQTLTLEQMGTIVNNFISSIPNNLGQLSGVIDSLTQPQKLAVINISGSVTILFCLFTLIGVYFGD